MAEELLRAQRRRPRARPVIDDPFELEKTPVWQPESELPVHTEEAAHSAAAAEATL